MRTRILLVDDDILNHWLITDTLMAQGFTVTGLCRGHAAVEMLADGNEFDLLLTDFHMPDGMSGFELAEHWRRVHPGRPILYTSNYSQLAIGALNPDEAYIRKHADTPDLLKVISELLDTMPLAVMPVSSPRKLYVH